MFIPRVKQEKTFDSYRLTTYVKVYFADATAKSVLPAIAELMPYLKLKVLDTKKNADFVFETRAGISDKAEYYELSSDLGKLFVSAKDRRGHVNALATLAQLISYKDGEFYITAAEIADYPDKPFRSFMLDTGRKYIDIPEFKAQILMMAKAKMNKLHWHISDAQGYPIEFDCYNFISPDKAGRKYTKDEVRELVAYAAIFGIDIIPEIDMPGHSFSLVRAIPELACKTKRKPNTWCMCISNEKSYDYVRAILTEIAELFPYEYIHIGTDEIDMRDVKSKHGWEMQDWCKCESCNKFFRKLGAKTVTERFYYFLRRAYDIVTSLGKKLMIWNDNIDIAKSPDLPRDILIEFWRVAEVNRGPREGCSMQKFIDEGFEVINADYPMTYIDLPEYLTWDKIKTWDLTSFPAESGDKAYQILGAETCAWDVQVHWPYSLYTVVPAFADRCYNLAPVTDEDGFKVALTRLALGPATPAGLNIFGTYVRDIVMTDDSGKILAKDCDKEAFRAILKALKKQNSAEKALTTAYSRRIR